MENKRAATRLSGCMCTLVCDCTPGQPYLFFIIIIIIYSSFFLFCFVFNTHTHRHTHKDTTEQSNKYMHRQYTLRILDSLFALGHQLAVANSSSEIESISLYTCRAYFFTFFSGNCNWNEWLVRPNNGHCKWPQMQKSLM